MKGAILLNILPRQEEGESLFESTFFGTRASWHTVGQGGGTAQILARMFRDSIRELDDLHPYFLEACP
jgi:hypothetical protein